MDVRHLIIRKPGKKCRISRLRHHFGQGELASAAPFGNMRKNSLQYFGALAVTGDPPYPPTGEFRKERNQ